MEDEPTASKKIKYDKGTNNSIVPSGSNEAHNIIVSPPKILHKDCSISVSPRTPSQAMPRKQRKARRKNQLATPKITEWLQIPSNSPTPAKSDDQKRKRNRKKTILPKDPSSSTPASQALNTDDAPTFDNSLSSSTPTCVATQQDSKPSNVSATAAKKCRMSSINLKQLTTSTPIDQLTGSGPGKDAMSASKR